MTAPQNDRSAWGKFTLAAGRRSCYTSGNLLKCSDANLLANVTATDAGRTV